MPLLSLLCLLALSAHSLAATPIVGSTYFTKYNFKIEKERHLTTNYWRGEMIPINTPVVLKSIGAKEFTISIDGRLIVFKNVRKFTLRDPKVIAEELLSPSRLTIPGNAERRDDIESGTLRFGMTKQEVIMTRGYPPRHKTSSTKANRWVYWSSRFVQRTLVFRNNVLVEGRGLH